MNKQGRGKTEKRALTPRRQFRIKMNKRKKTQSVKVMKYYKKVCFANRKTEKVFFFSFFQHDARWTNNYSTGWTKAPDKGKAWTAFPALTGPS